VSGKIDLAFADSMRVTVVDWKLGESEGGGDDSLQLALYGMWALEHFGCNVEDLRICKAYLSSGDIVDFLIDQPLITAARARIQQDIERMAALHDYGQHGIAEAFTPCFQLAICRMCAFEKVCYDRD
jgi:CRISPR/Cas system-associated exonuclease Cas4 (RecB family)